MWADGKVTVADPAFHPRAMGGSRRGVTTLVVGNSGQHALKRWSRQRHQDAEDQLDLGQAQQRDFF